MRRYTFYSAIALLAFGIGSFVVFNFYWNNPAEVIKEKPIESKPIEQNTVDEMTTAKFSCEDEAVRTVWSKLERDSKFIAETWDAIEARHLNNCQELFEKQIADLNDDKSDEVILRGIYGLFCGSSGDCPTWIISKISNKYTIIFESSAGESPNGLQFLLEKTHGFKDIKVKLNNGWASNNFGFFKFDGIQYRIKKCLEDVNSNYDYDNSNKEKLKSVKFKECL